MHIRSAKMSSKREASSAVSSKWDPRSRAFVFFFTSSKTCAAVRSMESAAHATSPRNVPASPALQSQNGKQPCVLLCCSVARKKKAVPSERKFRSAVIQSAREAPQNAASVKGANRRGTKKTLSIVSFCNGVVHCPTRTLIRKNI